MNTLVKQFSDSSIARWYRALSKREQILVIVVLVLVGLVMSYVLFTAVQSFRNESYDAYQQKVQDFEWMKANVAQAKLKAGMTRDRDDQDWTPIHRNAALHNIEIQRITPSANGAAIDLKIQPFQDVVNWIFALQEDAGMRIEEVRLSEVDPGLVNTSLVIQ